MKRTHRTPAHCYYQLKLSISHGSRRALQKVFSCWYVNWRLFFKRCFLSHYFKSGKIRRKKTRLIINIKNYYHHHNRQSEHIVLDGNNNGRALRRKVPRVYRRRSRNLDCLLERTRACDSQTNICLFIAYNNHITIKVYDVCMHTK